MTTTVEAPAQVIGALRRGDMDWRDAMICRAVWRSWSQLKPPPSYRELARLLDTSSSIIHKRVFGESPNPSRRQKGGLIGSGWLAGEVEGSYKNRTLTPGYRMGGCDSDGWPLEKVLVTETREISVFELCEKAGTEGLN